MNPAIILGLITLFGTIGAASINKQPEMQYNQNMLMLAMLQSKDPIQSLILYKLMTGGSLNNITGGSTTLTETQPPVSTGNNWYDWLINPFWKITHQ